MKMQHFLTENRANWNNWKHKQINNDIIQWKVVWLNIHWSLCYNKFNKLISVEMYAHFIFQSMIYIPNCLPNVCHHTLLYFIVKGHNTEIMLFCFEVDISKWKYCFKWSNSCFRHVRLKTIQKYNTVVNTLSCF